MLYVNYISIKLGKKKKYSLYATSLGFWGDTSSKEPAWQCRRHKRSRFNPWVGKILWWQAWQLATVLFPGESLGQRSLADYSPLQFRSVILLCPTLCDLTDCNTPGFPVLHHLPVCSNTCPLSQWCHPIISSSAIPFSFCLRSFPSSGSFQWVCSLHQGTKVLELQLQHQLFQWIFRVDFL